MIHHNNISLPISVEYQSLETFCLSDFFKHNKLTFNRALLLTGQRHSSKLADKIIAANTTLPIDVLRGIDNTLEKIEELHTLVQQKKYDLIIAVGGGKVLDSAKYLSTLADLNFISIPTLFSTDAIASPISILEKNNVEKGFSSRIPMAIIIDLDVIQKSPRHSLTAGLGDLFSNKSALLDWQLAIDAHEEESNHFARILSQFSLSPLEKSMDFSNSAFLQSFTDAIIMAGLAMNFSGNTRPCSGAEHLIAHALNEKGFHRESHGLLVGSTTAFCLFLHGKFDEQSLTVCRRLAFALNFLQGFSAAEMRDIFKLAKLIRGKRYTILNHFTDQQLVEQYEKFINSIEVHNGFQQKSLCLSSNQK